MSANTPTSHDLVVYTHNNNNTVCTVVAAKEHVFDVISMLSHFMQFSLSTHESVVNDKDTPMWYIKSITHSNPNVTSDRNVLFEYNSIKYSLKAPIGFVFTCSKLTIVRHGVFEC